MNQEVPLEEMTRKGAMTKSPFEMSAGEYAAWQRDVQMEARDYLFSIGQPYVTRKNGQVIAEFVDGRMQTLD